METTLEHCTADVLALYVTETVDDPLGPVEVCPEKREYPCLRAAER
jgi:hypothetical protein